MKQRVIHDLTNSAERMSTVTQSPAKKLKVLLVEDDEDFRKAVRIEIERLGFVVTAVSNADDALVALGSNKFDLAVSDVKMPGAVNGLGLLKEIKEKKHCPVVLMTGFGDLMEAHKSASLGCDAFLAKPFKRKDLSDAVGKALLTQKIERGDRVDEDYCKICIEDFVSGRQLKAGIFLRLPDGNFVKVANQGEDLAEDRVKLYRSRGIRFLYLHRTEYRAYLEQNQVLLAKKSDPAAMSPEMRSTTVRAAIDQIEKNSVKTSMPKESVENAMASIQSAISVLTDTVQGVQVLQQLQKSEPVYQHSLIVAFFSALIARRLKWNAPVTMAKIAFSGLFHDIGLSEIGGDWAVVDADTLSSEDKAKMIKHPEVGAQWMAQTQMFADEIIQGITQHHEYGSESGYPTALMRTKVQPLARLLCVADHMAICIQQGLSVDDSLKKLYGEFTKRFDHQYLDALALALGVDLKSLQTLVKSAA